MIYAIKKLFLPTILATFLALAVTTFVHAQNTSINYDVTVSPVFFDLAASPGTTVSDKIRIRNNTTSPLPIKIAVQKLDGDLNGDLTIKKGSEDSSLSWIKFSDSSIVAQPLEWTDVPFSVQVPQNAAFGYYYAITFEQDNSSPIAQTGAAISGAAAVPILLNVRKEGAVAEAKIVDFSTKSYINEFLPVDFNIKISNEGNIHIKPHGNIFINTGNGKDLAVLDVNPDLGIIIPGTNKIYNVGWDDGFLVEKPVMEDGQVKVDKNGKPIKKLTVNWDKLTSLRIGKYTANLLLVFDNGEKDVPIESSITFWVFPYKAVIVLLIGVIILFLLVRKILKSYVNKEIKRRSRG